MTTKPKLPPFDTPWMLLLSAFAVASAGAQPSGWQPGYGPGLSGVVRAVTPHPDGGLLLGGTLASGDGRPAEGLVHLVDGEYRPLDHLQGAPAEVFDFLVTGNGVVVTGSFTGTGSGPIGHVGVWHPTGVVPLGEGFDRGGRVAAWYDDDLVVGGQFSTADGAPASAIARWSDPTGWLALGEGVDLPDPFLPEVLALAQHGPDLIVGGSFIEAGGAPAFFVARWDGVDWSPVGLGTNGTVAALASFEGRLYAGGAFTEADSTSLPYLARLDGSAWEPVGGGVDGPVSDLVVDGDRLLVTGSFDTVDGAIAADGLAAFDGDAWTALPEGHRPTPVTVIHDGERLVVVGNGPVAILDDDRWSHPGKGTSSRVLGFAEHAGAFHMMGGFIRACGSTTTSKLVRYDGDCFDPVAPLLISTDTLSTAVHAMVTFEDDLVMGGHFGDVGGADAKQVARFDGATWSGVATGLRKPEGASAFVYALAVVGDTLVAGGDFAVSDGLPVPNLAALVDDAWVPLGGGTSDAVHALLPTASGLVVGGAFTGVGPSASRGTGMALPHVGRFDGAAWHPLGDGLDDTVRVLVEVDGDVWAGGDFRFSGSTPVDGVARFDGDAWMPVDAGVTGPDATVHALSAYAGGVWVGGRFTTAGGMPLPRLARWRDGPGWDAPMTVPDDEVLSLGTFDGLLFVGGWFTSIGDVPAAHVAAYRDDLVPVDPPGTDPSDPPVAEARLTARPRPFTSTVTVLAALDRATEVRIDVVDVTGRRVRNLVDGRRAAGVHAFTWDGRDRSGHGVPSGVYWAVLEADGRREVTRLVRGR